MLPTPFFPPHSPSLHSQLRADSAMNFHFQPPRRPRFKGLLASCSPPDFVDSFSLSLSLSLSLCRSTERRIVALPLVAVLRSVHTTSNPFFFLPFIHHSLSLSFCLASESSFVSSPLCLFFFFFSSFFYFDFLANEN